jgi:hypothetical protein
MARLIDEIEKDAIAQARSYSQLRDILDVDVKPVENAGRKWTDILKGRERKMDFKDLDGSDILLIGMVLIGIVFAAVGLILVMGALWAFPIMWCWNYLALSWIELPFAIPTVTWLQAFALYLTGSMLLRDGAMHVKFGSVGQFCLTLFLILLSTLSAFILQWSWNNSLVTLFGFPALAWGQAFCLLFLCNFLIKSKGIHQLEKEKE